ELATRLDPANVEVWRSRAQLLFHRIPYELREPFQARRSDCLEILDECAQHDRENALYDYLAALYMWSQSATYEYVDFQTGYRLIVQDRLQFELGTRRLKSGLAKRYLQFGTYD